MTPYEARRRLENIPGAGYQLEPDDITAIKVVLKDNERLAWTADQQHARIEALENPPDRGAIGRKSTGSGA